MDTNELIVKRVEAEMGVAELRELNSDMLAALRAQHKAIDILLAMLIERDHSFRPTKSPVWPMLQQGHAAIAKAELRAKSEQKTA